jgi:hypothetical protein
MVLDIVLVRLYINNENQAGKLYDPTAPSSHLRRAKEYPLREIYKSFLS